MLNSLNDALEKYLLQHCCYIASVVSNQQRHFYFLPLLLLLQLQPYSTVSLLFPPPPFPSHSSSSTSIPTPCKSRCTEYQMYGKTRYCPLQQALLGLLAQQSRPLPLPPQIPNLILNSHSTPTIEDQPQSRTFYLHLHPLPVTLAPKQR